MAMYTGVIVSNGLSMGDWLMWFVNTLVDLEGEMASVERLIEYQELPLDG